MEGIYLTEEGKQEIEAKIAKLDRNIKQFESIMPTYDPIGSKTQLFVYKQILSSVTVLPVYKSWEDVELFPPDNESQNIKTLGLINGVIIKS